MTQIKEVNEQAYDWLMNTVDQNAWWVALQYGGYKPKKFVHEYYSRKFYEVCYSHEVSTTNEQRLWKNDRNPTSILPPKYKKGLGRPKKIRRREPDEDPNPTKLSGKKQPRNGTPSKKVKRSERSIPVA
ncbi:hypothetical protein JHK82_055602 [Glycine max]|nr:hypothetical protein JHK86_055428 [Glycine max]KAG4918159.1 hypothetical protein JHK85_056440 [Glycine max]KAG5074236.1 hypothetical protein JHK84_055467 [Glycine max]KAG5076907.1 hypothetical protein JHK82_055602 [Glycine max]